ncbi:hypothetical protein OEZ86_012894 [Tetradesmus obliquus]|nr:hypothetical protein OEZ86_012894 [Tetradesmus obliquus]
MCVVHCSKVKGNPMTATKRTTSSMLLLVAVALLATTCSARTLNQEFITPEATPLAATSSFNPSALAAHAAASFCPCMESDAAAVAAAGPACNLDTDPNADCTNKAEFPLEAAQWVAAYYAHNKLWPPARFAKAASLSQVGADGQTQVITSSAAASGVVPAGVWTFNYKLGPFRLSGTIDTGALSVTAKEEVKILFWWKTIGSININTARPCITLGYPKIVGMSLCLELPSRALVLRASIVGQTVTVNLVRW